MDWSKLPDLIAVALLASAFASVARRSHNRASSVWLTGWFLIALHFLAFMFLNAPGNWGVLAANLGLSSLAGAGILFMWASVPYRNSRSSILMLAVLLFTSTTYIVLLSSGVTAHWALDLAATLFGLGPVVVALTDIPALRQPFRWILISLYVSLSIVLFIVQNRADNGPTIALNAVLFTVYLGCCIHFWYAYRRSTAGAFITITGFGAWALVFVIGPYLAIHHSEVHIQDEVWNLPKYVVAVGMILLLYEGQLEHSKYLALHDELTGLPNRRLFLDRLAMALERARRLGTKAALLVVDLDEFKRVNDTLGHHAGDLILRQVGEMFTSRVRRSDTVARTGGDEFCLILEEPTDRAQAKQVARSLMMQLNQPQEVNGTTVWVGASVGIAVFPDDATEIESLCIAADLRMYGEKRRTGKQKVSTIPSKPHAVSVIKPTASPDAQ